MALFVMSDMILRMLIHVCSIDFLAVHPELQGQGHGRALLQFIMQRADSDDMALFLVATNKEAR